MALKLYPFRFRDPVTGKWVRARYKAERDVIAERYPPGDYEITGPPEERECGDSASYFNPGGPRQVAPPAEGIERAPLLSDVERYLVLVFLRRYITWTARKYRLASMREAARLYRRIEVTM